MLELLMSVKGKYSELLIAIRKVRKVTIASAGSSP